jgi:tetratricopeptide (TPR) repeat protein
MKEYSPAAESRPKTEEMEKRLSKLRLGFFGVLGLYAIIFGAVQLLYYLYGGILGWPGVYSAAGGFFRLTAGAWLVSLVVPAVLCYAFLLRQDARNREILTRRWDSWRWFDYGVEMIGTDYEYSENQEECFARAANLDPEDPYARNNLGAVLSQQGRLDEAIVAYRQAIKKNPDYYKAYSNLGAAYACQGETRTAIGLYRKALKLNPRDAASHLNLGLALARLGNVTQAAAHLREFLNLAPDHPRRLEISDFLSRLTVGGYRFGPSPPPPGSR